MMFFRPAHKRNKVSKVTKLPEKKTAKLLMELSQDEAVCLLEDMARKKAWNVLRIIKQNDEKYFWGLLPQIHPDILHELLFFESIGSRKDYIEKLKLDYCNIRDKGDIDVE